MKEQIDGRDHTVDQTWKVGTEIGLHLFHGIYRGCDSRDRTDLLDASCV